MATNRDLLKEAIADAKAVKEMAIANAKAALEEAFTPQLKTMLSAKLQEMEKEEMKEEELDEDGFEKMDSEEKGFDGQFGNINVNEEEEDMMEVDLEELLAELELEEGEEVEESLNEAEEEEAEEEEEEEGEEEEEEGDTEMEDLSDDELKEMIEDVIAQMIKDGELEAGPEFEEEAGEEGEEMEMGAEEEEEVDLAELLKEIEEMEKDEMKEEKPINEYFAGGASIDPVIGAWVFGIFGAALSTAVAAIYRSWKKDEKLKGMKDAEVAKIAAADKEFQKSPEAVNALKDEAAELAADAKQNVQERVELEEAYKTIDSLRSELNEINLLNAKLLYTNKIFKSKNLNENQKVKVLSSFDKAKNVGEVKMVFETLSEGIKVKKDTIKENLGRASKATTIPTTKKPIVESNDVFERMQKLAGIIK